jgi:hypothetical protein
MRPIPATVLPAVALALGAFLLAPASATAQEPPPPAGQATEGAEAPEPETLRVFLDCGICDFDYVRTEIGWVNWMRDRADSDLHVLVRSQVAGGGGQVYTLDFIGRGDFAARSDTLRYVAGRDNTSAMTRSGITQTLRLGLVRWVADTPMGERLAIGLREPAPGVPGVPPRPAVPEEDPWNFWTFTLGGGTNLDGESTRSNYSVNGNVRASRITEIWKIDLRANGRYVEQSFEVPVSPQEFRTVTSINRNYGANALVARGISDHLSVGGRSSLTTSTFGNTRYAFDLAPAVEYNLFPYAESTRRSLIVQYSMGLTAQAYREVTIFDQMDETRGTHALSTSYSTRQTWGDVNVSLNGSQYLHDRGLYNLVFFTGTNLNLFRGFRLNVFGNYALVRDQLSLPRRDATEDEVLLRQRQLATNYRYFMSVGLSYRFGSPVQNVVNPRFGSSGGGTMVFF